MITLCNPPPPALYAVMDVEKNYLQLTLVPTKMNGIFPSSLGTDGSGSLSPSIRTLKENKIYLYQNIFQNHYIN